MKIKLFDFYVTPTCRTVGGTQHPSVFVLNLLQTLAVNKDKCLLSPPPPLAGVWSSLRSSEAHWCDEQASELSA